MKKTIFMVLQDDVVEKVIMSNDTYYTHHLSLADPAIIAQQRSCDNMAITYKLKDVSLTSTDTVDTTSTIEQKGLYAENEINNNVGELCQDTEDNYFSSQVFGKSTTTHGQLIANRKLVAYRFLWKQPTFTFDMDNNPSVSYSDNIALKNLMANYVNTASITFDVPMIELSIGKQGTSNYEKVGMLPTEVKITRYNASNNTYEWYDNSQQTWVANEFWNTSAPSSILGDNSFVDIYNQGGLETDTIYWVDSATPYNSIRQYSKTPKYVDSLNSTNIIAKQVIETSYSTDYIDVNTNLPMNRRITFNTDAGYTYYIDLTFHYE